jgi:hypothetical protein
MMYTETTREHEGVQLFRLLTVMSAEISTLRRPSASEKSEGPPIGRTMGVSTLLSAKLSG